MLHRSHLLWCHYHRYPGYICIPPRWQLPVYQYMWLSLRGWDLYMWLKGHYMVHICLHLSSSHWDKMSHTYFLMVARKRYLYRIDNSSNSDYHKCDSYLCKLVSWHNQWHLCPQSPSLICTLLGCHQARHCYPHSSSMLYRCLSHKWSRLYSRVNRLHLLFRHYHSNHCYTNIPLKPKQSPDHLYKLDS